MVAYFLKLPYDEYVSKVKALMKLGDPMIEEDFTVFESTAKEVLRELHADAEENFVNSRLLSTFISSWDRPGPIKDEESFGVIYATLEMLYTKPEEVRRMGIYLAKLNQPIV
ncbi:MAG: hypothetical protein LBT06_04910 [Hungatella sp.]|jgi:hypothetical protein|nr:hypothetical protein [Hungatella sp.]